MLKRKSAMLMAVALTVGSLCITMGVEGGCWNLGTQAFMTSLRPCGIFNCSAGLFGGAINLCGQPGNPLDDVVAGCP